MRDQGTGDSVPGDGLPSGPPTKPSPHCVLTWRRGLLYKGTDPIRKGSTLMANHPQRPRLLIPSPSDSGVNTRILKVFEESNSVVCSSVGSAQPSQAPCQTCPHGRITTDPGGWLLAFKAQLPSQLTGRMSGKLRHLSVPHFFAEDDLMGLVECHNDRDNL